MEADPQSLGSVGEYYHGGSAAGFGDPRPVLLHGWGRTKPTAARVATPSGADVVAQLQQLLAEGSSGLIARGLGRSYGDAAQCAGGTVVDFSRADVVESVDVQTRTVRARAGTSVDRLLRTLVPRGFFVPVSPGTRWVSLGGAIAADIHGKNHHADGSIGSWISDLSLVSPRGGVQRLAPDSPNQADRNLYWATVGGMGLTGVIVEAGLRLVDVETSMMRVDTERADNLDDLMARMEGADAGYRYSVAWIDCLARGHHLGRGVLTRANHASVGELAPDQRSPERALAYRSHALLGAPSWFPGGLLNPKTIRLFNEVWFRRAPKRETGRLQPIASYFYPLDSVRDWNRIYGRRGFVQYQLTVPSKEGRTVRTVIERLAEGGFASFLAVLKRFGRANDAPLSFPAAGWTLAMDLPLGADGLGKVLDDLDGQVAEAGGRVYLAKDARLRPDLVEAMYPRVGEWKAVRELVDPDGTMSSDLGRRLGLVGDPRAPRPGAASRSRQVVMTEDPGQAPK